MFCIECGREVDRDDELIGGVCVQCFLEHNPIVRLPPVLDLVRCPRCGAVKVRGGWRPAPRPTAGRRGRGGAEMDEDEDVRGAVSSAVEGALEAIEGARVNSVALRVLQEDRAAFVVDVQAMVQVGAQEVPQELATRVRLRPEACDVCSRRAGNYFEAIVQFRGARSRGATDRDLATARKVAEDEAARLEAASREAHIVKVEEPRGGLDFYLSTQSAGSQVARALAARFGASVSMSTSQGGRKDGRDLVRTTHIVRMPDRRSGDYVLFEGELVRVLSATDRDALVTPAPGGGRRRTVSHGDRDALVLVGTEEDVEDAVIVSRSAGEVQVLDPSTMRTVELVLPKGFDLGGRETVGVLRHEGRLLLAR